MGTSCPDLVGAVAVPAAALGLCLPALVAGGVPGAAVALCLLAAGAVALLRSAPLAVGAALLAATAGVAWSQNAIGRLAADPLAPLVGRQVDTRALVTGVPREGPFGVSAVAELAGGGLVDLRVGRGRAGAVRPGAILAVRGRLARPQPPRTPGGFDERTWLARQGVHELLRARTARLVARRGGVAGRIDAVRESLRATLRSAGDDEAARVVQGVVLGGAGALAPETREAFRDSGLAHLLAVSGGNIALLVAAVLAAAWAAGLRRAAGHGLAAASVLLYAAVVGPSPSVVRAAAAGVAASLAWLANRPAQRWHVLALGAAAVSAVDPYAPLEPGFQLSFAAVLAIFVLVPRLRGWLEGVPCPAPLRLPLAVSAACTLATAPIAFAHFGRVSLGGSLPANLLALPAVPPLLWLSLVAAVLAPLTPAAAVPPVLAADALGAYLVVVARLGSWLDAALSWPRLAAVAALVALARIGRGRLRALRVVAALVVVALVLPLPGRRTARDPPAALRLTVLDVGQGSAALLEAPGLAVLVDAGAPEAGVVRHLGRLGVRRLDALVLSHPQRDHVGGAADVLRRLAVRRVLDPHLRAASTEQAGALSVARERGVPVVRARRGLVVRHGGVVLRVLGPRAGTSAGELNDQAVVVSATQGSCRFLLPADAESRSTLPLGPPPAGVLVVAHHGSADPQLPRLLRTVRPRLAVISVGAGNPYGHPTASTLAALARARVAVRRTDRDGDVSVQCPPPASEPPRR